MKQHKTLEQRWLWLGVAALAIAGIFAIILVVARTPQLKSLPIVQGLFDVALVVHVDLSVLLWFLAVGAMGWSGLIAKHPGRWPFWNGAAFCSGVLATALIALSPLGNSWEVVQSNYIPVLNNPIFFAGLGLLFASMTVLLIQLLVLYLPAKGRALLNDYVDAGFFYAGITTFMTLIMFALSAHLLPNDLPLKLRFETLFWAGGHMLQVTFTLLMMAAWVALLQLIRKQHEKTRLILVAFVLTLLAGLASAAGFSLHPFNTTEFTEYQSWVMKWLLGIGPSLLSLYVFTRLMGSAGLWKARASRAFTSCLMMSLILFGVGGTLGMMISGQNVGIPAHYHGQIVGVTLALMGLAYAMLPRFGYAHVASWRLAFWQPIIYGVGQLMHIGGLAYSGGYGVLRKMAGGFDSLTPDVKAALGVMGAGGMLAIIGGILFVVVMFKSLKKSSASLQSPKV